MYVISSLTCRDIYVENRIMPFAYYIFLVMIWDHRNMENISFSNDKVLDWIDINVVNVQYTHRIELASKHPCIRPIEGWLGHSWDHMEMKIQVSTAWMVPHICNSHNMSHRYKKEITAGQGKANGKQTLSQRAKLDIHTKKNILACWIRPKLNLDLFPVFHSGPPDVLGSTQGNKIPFPCIGYSEAGYPEFA